MGTDPCPQPLGTRRFGGGKGENEFHETPMVWGLGGMGACTQLCCTPWVIFFFWGGGEGAPSPMGPWGGFWEGGVDVCSRPSGEPFVWGSSTCTQPREPLWFEDNACDPGGGFGGALGPLQHEVSPQLTSTCLAPSWWTWSRGRWTACARVPSGTSSAPTTSFSVGGRALCRGLGGGGGSAGGAASLTRPAPGPSVGASSRR